MLDFAVGDTEDNSPELQANDLSGFEKKVTQISAIKPNGDFFYLQPKVKRVVKQNGIKRYIMDVEPFLNFLDSLGFCFVYFHNLTYDLGNIFPYDLDKLDLTMVGNRLITAKWKKIIFRDSFNIWPMALKKIGEKVGIKKLTTDVYSKEYVDQDCKIVRKAMQLADRFSGQYEVVLPSTLGTLCIRLWQAIGGSNWHCSHELAKLAYYGGRVELFSNGGTGNIYYTDVNSLYPYTMTFDYPTAMDEWLGCDDQATCESIVRNLKIKCYGVATVVLDVPKCRIAPLPVIQEDQSIYYPYGRIKGTYTLLEIRNAMKHGARLVEMSDCHGSLTGYPYYRKFVKQFYQQRKMETDEGMKLFLKLLMNNLYGQLGMSGLVTRSLSLNEHVVTDQEGTPIFDVNGQPMLSKEGIPYGEKLLADVQMPLPEHANYLHAAYVTSYARIVLQDFMRKVPADNLIYCDTDSVFFFQDEAKKLPFPIGKELGEMKLEDRLAGAWVNAPKFYHLKTAKGKHIYKAKGVPQRPINEDQEKYKKGQLLIDMGKDQNDETLIQQGEQMISECRFLPEQFFKKGSAQFQQPYRLRESIAYMSKKQFSKDTKHQTEKVLSVWRDVEKRVVTNYKKKILKDGIYYPRKNVETD